MRTVAIIQARMASSRLPGKVMADVAGKPLLDCVIKHAQQARALDLVTVATSTRATDDIVAQFCDERSIPCFRGSEEDVLDRFYQAARHFGADTIVRLTADCPLLDQAVIDKVIHAFHTGHYDYTSNTLEPTYPDGLDTEVFSQQALEWAWKEACLKSEREHVTSYIWKRPEQFRLANVRHDEDLSGLRWTVDEAQDLEFVRRVYDCLGSTPAFGMMEILALLEQRPELKQVNATLTRNEGYEKSIREDGAIRKDEEN